MAHGEPEVFVALKDEFKMTSSPPQLRKRRHFSYSQLTPRSPTEYDVHGFNEVYGGHQQ